MNKVEKFNEEFREFCNKEIVPIIEEYIKEGEIIWIKSRVGNFYGPEITLTAYKGHCGYSFGLKRGFFDTFPENELSFAGDNCISFEDARKIMLNWEGLKQKFISKAKKIAKQKEKEFEVSKIKFNLLNEI